MAPTPITIVTGFLGSGKTTLILNLIPQLPKAYKLALLKNEFGDVAIDSQLASSQSISGVRELLNGCICCNLVGQLGEALFQLRNEVHPDRIVIETSGSAFPAGLAMEVNRLAREGKTDGEDEAPFVLDGVVSVIDVENWKGYEDTSYTAKMQAKYTDLIVFNKWELVDERKFDDCLDRVGDLEVQIAWVKSVKGWVDVEIVMGIDKGLVKKEGVLSAVEWNEENVSEVERKQSLEDEKKGNHHHHHHQSEVEVLSVVLEGTTGVDMDAFEELLLAAPKDEVYRIKGLVLTAQPPPDSTGARRDSRSDGGELYVLNWAFGRWTYTSLPVDQLGVMRGAAARLTFILARGESMKWIKKLGQGELVQLEGGEKGELEVKKIG